MYGSCIFIYSLLFGVNNRRSITKPTITPPGFENKRLRSSVDILVRSRRTLVDLDNRILRNMYKPAALYAVNAWPPPKLMHRTWLCHVQLLVVVRYRLFDINYLAARLNDLHR